MEKINFCRTLFEETRFMSLLIKSTLSSIVARHGLNPYQAHLLGEIASQDGQTIKELAYHLCVKPSNFKPIAQPLEERGLIERRQDENDKRSRIGRHRCRVFCPLRGKPRRCRAATAGHRRVYSIP